MNPLFVVIYNFGEKFIGGNSYENSKWKEVKKGEIKAIIYYLPTGDSIILSDYTDYFFMIEAVVNFNLKNSINNKEVNCVYLMGRKNKKVVVYKTSLKTSNIECKIYGETDSFVKKLNQDYWK